LDFAVDLWRERGWKEGPMHCDRRDRARCGCRAAGISSASENTAIVTAQTEKETASGDFGAPTLPLPGVQSSRANAAFPLRSRAAGLPARLLMTQELKLAAMS
jgi:hypothetical protein